MSSTSTVPAGPSVNRTIAGSGVGGALGVLVVIFMPSNCDVALNPGFGFCFSPETASMATAALGVVFGYLIRFLPKPKN